MSSLWTCNICHVCMLVEDGPYHLVEPDHIDRLISYLTCKSLALLNQTITPSQSFPVFAEANNNITLAQSPQSSPEPENSISVRHATPIDRFFESFPSFRYNSSLMPSTSYNRLLKHHGWQEKSLECKEAWELYQDALREEFHLWFGLDDDLDAWHALCRAVGLDPPPGTCEECQEAVQYRHVNLIDLIHWRRHEGKTGCKKVHVFRTVRDLSSYSVRHKKIFSRESRKEWEKDGVILRFLLRHIWSPERDEHLSV